MGLPDFKSWTHFDELPEANDKSLWLKGVTPLGLESAVPSLDDVGHDLLSVFMKNVFGFKLYRDVYNMPQINEFQQQKLSNTHTLRVFEENTPQCIKVSHPKNKSANRPRIKYEHSTDQSMECDSLDPSSAGVIEDGRRGTVG